MTTQNTPDLRDLRLCRHGEISTQCEKCPSGRVMAQSILAQPLEPSAPATFIQQKSEDQTDAELQLQDLLAPHRYRKCSEWEQEFVESLQSQVQCGSILSRKQLNTLNNIWERHT